MPQTKAFFRHLKASYEAAKEEWANEQFIGTDIGSTALANAKALGGLQVLRDLIESGHEDIGGDE